MTPAQLNAWANTMAERGIRIRVDFEDAIGQWQGSEQSDEGSGSDVKGDEEIEAKAREKRRLMPY